MGRSATEKKKEEEGRWSGVVNCVPRLLYPQGGNVWYTLNRRLSGPYGHSRHGVEKLFHATVGYRAQDFPAPSLVIILTVLSGLTLHME